ncbi:hypothetical protein GCM10008101_06920 [Lysobacter xinjiangensis]|uniref:DUF4097 domain-containing protein n=1 Tax=Cognatilysobacter xinjiangensis TaxID=546892 RepID=A0ABQ3BVP4_9GAMM|nr:DUF4097 family beta strand repeat-containing protein [Lysobacter xinjiangensis]GGZ56119.1 hypothetical protein GCM10008101_06920 [Lysobacter xinjiangensis]
MKTVHVTSLALAAAVAFAAAPAFAATPINQSRPLDPRGRVEIENMKGTIEVRAWDRAEVKIEGMLGEGVEKLEIEGDGRELSISVRYPQSRGLRILGNRKQAEPTVLKLMVPRRADLDISAVSADVLAWGVAPSQLSVDNVSGRTTIAGAADNVDIDSVSGDVEVTVNRANVNIESVSGTIRLSGRLGREVSVESVSGDVAVNVLDTAIERFEGNSVSGDLDVRTALAPQARVKLETVSGDVQLRLPRTVSAEIRGESFSGTLRAPGARVERPEHGPGSNFRQRYGSGSADVSIETFSGDADVRLE